MSTDIEQRLRKAFEREAAAAPALAPDAGARARRTVRLARATLGVGLGVVIAVAVPLALQARGVSSDAPVDVALPSNAPTGAVPDAGAGLGSCAEEYSPASLKSRQFAFEGTVAAIEPRAGKDDPSGWYTVTYAVTEWFSTSGDDSGTVSLVMVPPIEGEFIEEGPSYEIGTELLVSGDVLSNGHMVALPCGFVRYASEVDTQTWRQTFAG